MLGHELLQRLDKPLDFFGGVVRSEADANESATVSDAEFLCQRRGVEVPARYEEAVFQRVFADLPRRVPLNPERDGRGFAHVVWGGVELYPGDFPQPRAEVLASQASYPSMVCMALTNRSRGEAPEPREEMKSRAPFTPEIPS